MGCAISIAGVECQSCHLARSETLALLSTPPAVELLLGVGVSSIQTELDRGRAVESFIVKLGSVSIQRSRVAAASESPRS